MLAAWNRKTAFGSPQEDALITGVTSGTVTLYEVIQSLSLIDDRVLEALDFSSRGVESGWREATDYLHRLHALDGVSGAGLENRLIGYVGERQVAAVLAHQGHVVEFPSHPNQEGYDLLVDGHPLQVKTTMDPGAVTEHLSSHPDIHVAVNHEIAGHFITDDRVMAVHSLKESHNLVDETLRGTDSLTDWHLSIPWVTLAVRVTMYAPLVYKRHLTAAEASKNIVRDTLLIGGSGMILAQLGAILGMGFGPIGALAGSVVGCIIGGLVGIYSIAVVETGAFRKARAEYENLLATLGRDLPGMLRKKLEACVRKLEKLESKFPRSGRAKAWLWPTVNDRAFLRLRTQAQDQVRSTQGDLLEAERKLQGLSQSKDERTRPEQATGAFAIQLVDNGKLFVPELVPRINSICSAAQAVQQEHKKLEMTRQRRSAVSSAILRGTGKVFRLLLSAITFPVVIILAIWRRLRNR